MSTIKDQEKLWVSVPIQNPLLASFPSDVCTHTHTQTAYHVVCVHACTSTSTETFEPIVTDMIPSEATPSEVHFNFQ
jgi:hypothetical protein